MFSANLPFLAYVLNVYSPFLVAVYSTVAPDISFPSGSVIVFIPSSSATVAVAAAATVAVVAALIVAAAVAVVAVFVEKFAAAEEHLEF